jgi:NAD+ kinase
MSYLEMPHGKSVSSVGIVIKEGMDLALDVCSRLAKNLMSVGIRVYCVAPFTVPRADVVSEMAELERKSPDIVATVGGDGTLLRTLRHLSNETPILAVNVGIRGILSEIKPDEIEMAVSHLKTGNYRLEKRVRIEARMGETILPPASNEVYITRTSPIGTPTFTIRMNTGFYLQARMDGLLVSTPTGSTGHTYSLNGPVLHESLKSVVITPVAPILRIPPFVIPISPIEVSVNQITNLVIDGQEIYETKADKIIIVDRYRFDAVMVRFGESSLRQLTRVVFP